MFKSAYSRRFYGEVAHILSDIDTIRQLIHLEKKIGFTQS